MKTAVPFALTALFALALCTSGQALTLQEMLDGFQNFDETAEGPWSDLTRTTITIPKVPNGFIKQDAEVSSNEYGKFAGVEVIPVENAWVLGYATTKNWEGPDDSSFTFYAAYDDNYLYIGLVVKDDVVRSNDLPPAFWKDDAVEIVLDPTNSPADTNTDAVLLPYGGHPYFNYLGVFSDWDEATQAVNPNRDRWSQAIEWQFGEDKEVYALGKETSTGWTLEIKFHKNNFKNADGGSDMLENNKWAFNIGLDDDDGGDLAIQYFWANRIRAIGFPASDVELFTEEEIEQGVHYEYYTPGIDANGRLSTGGAGDLVFGKLTDVKVSDWSLF
jgi:hypothetical protein